MDLIFDIETDGLLKAEDGKPEGTKVHCLCVQEVGGSVESYHGSGLQDGLKRLHDASRLVGHNIQAFDLPFLKKVLGWSYEGQIFDTLIAARLVFPDIRNADFDVAKKNPKFPKELIGRHSLEAWGWRLNKHKGEKMEDWSTFTPEMLAYCEQDVAVTAVLYEWLAGRGIAPEALELETQFADVLDRQMKRGVGFDIKAAEKLYAELKGQEAALIEAVKDAFPPLVKRTKLKTKIKEEVIPFNPTSRAQIARGFKEKYGWKPEKLTPQGAPQVDEEVLASLSYPEAPGLLELMTMTKRLGQLSEGNQGLMRCVKRDGRIYGYINHNGAVTGRCTHSKPNLGQIPRGESFRTLFVPRPSWLMVGADASGLELRCLAHYMARYDGGAYRDVLLTGDIHTANQEAAGLKTRDQAKTFIYAFLYGAGAEKIGSIVGGGEKEGKALKASFLAKLPALKRLIDDVQAKAANNGFLLSLDRRKIRVRQQHAALNSLLQGSGAVVMKKAVVLLDQAIREAGMVEDEQYGQVLFVHDEVQFEVTPDYADFVGRTAVACITLAGEHFQFRCPLSGEYRVGKSWSETH